MTTLARVAYLVAALKAYDGPQEQLITCDACGATWYGSVGDTCGWCHDATQRQLEHQRQLLLWPDWMATGEAHERYSELDDVDKAIWRNTRGGVAPEAAAEWAQRLRRAADSGLITTNEAEQALTRAEKAQAA